MADDEIEIAPLPDIAPDIPARISDAPPIVPRADPVPPPSPGPYIEDIEHFAARRVPRRKRSRGRFRVPALLILLKLLGVGPFDGEI